MDEHHHEHHRHEPPEDYQFQGDHPSRGFRFDYSLNLGHVITAVSVLVAVLLAWSNLRNKVETHDAQIAEVKQSVEKVDAKIMKLDDKASESNVLLHELAVSVRLEGAKTRSQQQP